MGFKEELNAQKQGLEQKQDGLSKARKLAEYQIKSIKKTSKPCPECGKVHKTRCPSGPKQTARMLKAHCEPCNWIIRITRKCAAMGLPKCPVCSKDITLERK